jgi:hypothetical protein
MVDGVMVFVVALLVDQRAENLIIIPMAKNRISLR